MLSLSRSRVALLPALQALVPSAGLAALALVSLVAAPAAHAQTSYNFAFDNTPDNTTTPPFVGTGVFSFANDLGLGTFAYNALGPVTFSFNVNGQVFDQSNIVSDTSRTTVVFTAYNGGRRLQFSDTGNGAGGTYDGSFDLRNSSGSFLTFEPSFVGSGLNLYASNSFSPSGSYLATAAAPTAVPEPGEWAIMGMLGTSVCGLMVRARRKAKSDIGKKAVAATA